MWGGVARPRRFPRQPPPLRTHAHTGIRAAPSHCAPAYARLLIAGFVVADAPTRVLVRGAGPALATVPSRLSDPRISLHRHGVAEPIATNDDWGALLVSLDPGVYTVVVSGAGSTSGVALAEVYEVP